MLKYNPEREAFIKTIKINGSIANFLVFIFTRDQFVRALKCNFYFSSYVLPGHELVAVDGAVLQYAYLKVPAPNRVVVVFGCIQHVHFFLSCVLLFSPR